MSGLRMWNSRVLQKVVHCKLNHSIPLRKKKKETALTNDPKCFKFLLNSKIVGMYPFTIE